MNDGPVSAGVQVSPAPTDEEAAAIVAAIQVGLSGGADEPARPGVSRWRFSGRWWTRPVPVRRARPGG